MRITPELSDAFFNSAHAADLARKDQDGQRRAAREFLLDQCEADPASEAWDIRPSWLIADYLERL